MAKRGRPTDYRPEYAEQASSLCESGATDEEVASELGVSVATIYRWKHRHPEFCEALKAGKSPADERVVRSLYQRATGFRYTEQQAFKVKSPEGGERVEIVEVERFMQPDTTASIFWMKNRRRGEWSDKQELDLTGQIETIQRVITDPSPQETDEPGSREDAGHSDSARVPATARRSTV